MIKPKSWERVMKVHIKNADGQLLCHEYVYNPLTSLIDKKITCKKCLKRMEEQCKETTR